MRVTKRKKIRTVILIAVFTFLIGLMLLGFRFVSELLRITVSGQLQAIQAIENLERMTSELGDDADAIMAQRNAKRQITARALQEKDFSGWDGKVSAFGDGYIAEKEGDVLHLPDDAHAIPASEADGQPLPELTDEQKAEFTNDRLFFDTKNQTWCMFEAVPIRGNYFYVEFTPLSDQLNYTNRMAEVMGNVSAMETAYDIQIVLREGGADNIIYWPEELSEYERNLDALNVKKLDELQRHDIEGEVMLNDELFYYLSNVVGGAYQAVVFSSMFNGLEKVIPLVIPVCGMIFVCFFVFAFWIFSVFKFVRTERLTLNQQKNYLPKRIRSVSFGYMVISAILIFCIALYGCTLIGLYQANASCNRSLETLFERIDTSDGQLQSFKKNYDNNIVGELQYTAKLMERYPELMQEDFVKDVSTIIGADYLVVFNTDGKEYLTDSDLRGLSLGGPGDSNGAFLKLRNGVPSVINEPDKEDPNGFYMASYGVPLSFSDQQTYGVLAAYVSPKVRDSLKIFDKNEMIDLLAAGTGLIFTLDQESKNVIYSSEPDLIGRNVVDLGMEENQVKDHFMDFFRLNNTNYYGISQVNGNILYYVAIPQDDIFFGTGQFAATAAIPYICFFLILMVLLLRKYKEENIEWQDLGEVYDDSVDTVVLPSGEEKRTVDVSQRWKLLERFQRRKSPGNSARLLAEILALICITGGVIYFLASGKQALTQSSIFGYVIYGEWNKGFNVFALTSIVLLFCLVFFLSFVLELTGFVLNRFLNTKGETIGRLILNIARYILIVVFFYYALDDLGFDIRVVIASIGLASFALSLGMKDLVTDLIAGITIVFEGEYQVGDIVEIGGYRGSVIEVGVRSTKLMGQGGNIKIIANRDVKNVINMTHLNSWCAVEFTVSREEKMERMENMLEEALPEIKEKITGIISGPYYKGVTAFGHNGMTIVVTAECKERDLHRVQRALTGELNRVFEQNEVKF